MAKIILKAKTSYNKMRVNNELTDQLK